jgi:hypothetical protein
MSPPDPAGLARCFLLIRRVSPCLLQLLWLFLIFYGCPAQLDYFKVPSRCEYYETNQAALCCPYVEGQPLQASCLQANGGYYLPSESARCLLLHMLSLPQSIWTSLVA